MDYAEGNLIVQTLANLDRIRGEREREYKNHQQRYANPRIRQINTYRPAGREGYREDYRTGTRGVNYRNDDRRENNHRSNYNSNRKESRVLRLPDMRYPPPAYMQAGNRYEANTPVIEEIKDDHLN